MRKLIVRASISIDGFVGASNRELNFAKSRSPEGAAWLAEKTSRVSAHLMGRKTFQQMASFWPSAPGPVSKPMNEIPKIVFTRVGFDAASVGALGWREARVMDSGLAAGLTTLKNEAGGDLLAHGGVEFLQSLVATSLADEYWLIVHPLVAGAGLPLIGALDAPLDLKMVESTVFGTGVLGLVYQRG